MEINCGDVTIVLSCVSPASYGARFSSPPSTDVQHPEPEHTTRPAADAERAASQHERPAACEFTPSPTETNQRSSQRFLSPAEEGKNTASAARTCKFIP